MGVFFIPKPKITRYNRIMNTNPLLQPLTNLPIGEVKYYSSTGSTNDDALAWMEQEAPDLSIVVADEQTSGRGRLDRKWVTEHGSALAFTIILRLRPEEIPYSQLISPLAGIAVASAIEHLLHLPAQIKWPNDVLIHGKKVSGILVESNWVADKLAGVVVGIGVNIQPNSIPPAEMLNFPAACLDDFTLTRTSRADLLAEIVRQFIHWRTQLAFETFYKYWNEHLAFVGQGVFISGNLSQPISGILMGVDRNGELVLETSEGVQIIQVGDVHLRLRDE